MSILNLISDGIKTDQDVNVDSLNTRLFSIDREQVIVDMLTLFTRTVTVTDVCGTFILTNYGTLTLGDTLIITVNLADSAGGPVFLNIYGLGSSSLSSQLSVECTDSNPGQFIVTIRNLGGNITADIGFFYLSII